MVVLMYPAFFDDPVYCCNDRSTSVYLMFSSSNFLPLPFNCFINIRNIFIYLFLINFCSSAFHFDLDVHVRYARSDRVGMATRLSGSYFTSVRLCCCRPDNSCCLLARVHAKLRTKHLFSAYSPTATVRIIINSLAL